MGSITYVDFRVRRVVPDAGPLAFKPYLVPSRLRKTASLPIRDRVAPNTKKSGNRGRAAKGGNHVCSVHTDITSHSVSNVKLKLREILLPRAVRYNRRMAKPIKWHGMTDLGMRLEVIREVRTGDGRGNFQGRVKFYEEVGIKDSAYSNYLFRVDAKGFDLLAMINMCEKHGASLDWIVRGISHLMPHEDAVKFNAKHDEIRARVAAANVAEGWTPEQAQSAKS